MLIKFGALVTDGRGKVGGHVLTRSRAGKVFSTKSQPRNPGTLQQFNSRYYISLLSQYWQSLTDGKRLAWDDYATGLNEVNVFGDLKELSGFNAFVQANFGLLSVGVSIIDEPPTPSVETLLTYCDVDVSTAASKIAVVYEVSPLPADTALIVRMSRPLSPGVGHFSGSFRNLGVIDAGTNSPVNFYSEYVAAFGYVPDGAKIFCEFVQMSKKKGRKLVKFKPGADLKV